MPLLNAYVGVAVLFAVIIYGFEVCMMIREWFYLRNVGFPVMFADFLTVTEFEAQRTQKQLLMESEVIARHCGFAAWSYSCCARVPLPSLEEIDETCVMETNH